MAGLIGLIAQTLSRAAWIALFLDWAVELLFIGRERDRLAKTASLWKCRLFGAAAVMLFAATFDRSARFSLPATVSLGTGAVSLFVLALGGILHVKSRLYLGRHWSAAAEIQRDHRLITRGPYALVRNPIYLAEMLIGLATGLAFRSWLVLLLTLALAAASWFQGRIEERLLANRFGGEMEAYLRSTPMLFPTFRSLRAWWGDMVGSRRRREK